MLALFFISHLYSKDTLYNFKQSKGTNPFETLRTEGGTYYFYDHLPALTPYRIQHHLPYLIQNLLKIKEPVIHQSNTITYEIIPFKEIIMVNKETRISLGKYKRSFMKNNNYYQEFSCGDKCDLKKSTKRSSNVCFKGLSGDLRVESMVEKKLCSYSFVVGGEILARAINPNIEIGYTFVPHNSKKMKKKKEPEFVEEDKNEEKKIEKFKDNGEMFDFIKFINDVQNRHHEENDDKNEL